MAGILVLATFRDYGSTWDERFQVELGRVAVAWFETGGRDERALDGGGVYLHLYGAAFEVGAELAGKALPFDPVETRHLFNALVALVGCVGSALLARRLGGGRAMFAGAALLLTTPFWWGHGFSNSKDVPFASAYPWLLLALLRASDDLPRPGVRKVALAGAALGAALAFRPAGLIVLLPLAAGTLGLRLLPVLLRSPGGDRFRAVAAAAARYGVVVGLGWLGMIALWPYGLCNPVKGPFAAVSFASHFPSQWLVRFAGGWYQNTDLPRGYAPTWFAATLPETWFVVAAVAMVGAVVAWRAGARPAFSAGWLDRGVVALAAVGPIAAAVATRPVLFDGIRHLLFVVPALAALAGWALSAALDWLPRWFARASLAIASALAVLATVDAVRLHPYQYLYFNRSVAGGLARASRDYDLDFWGATGREAMEWVARNVHPDPSRPLRVWTSADPFVAAHWIERDPVASRAFTFVRTEPPDLRLSTTRALAHRATGRALHVVERMGVPLLYVIETGGTGSDLTLEAGDFAVTLTAPGWYGVATPTPHDERARYLLRKSQGFLWEAQALVVTPQSGPVPKLEELRALVGAAIASVPGVDARSIAMRPMVGLGGSGWIATGMGGAYRRTWVGLAAVRVGEVAILLQAQAPSAPEGAERELVELASGARAAVGSRVP